ncbi:MAG TPA: hypothetical protein VL404_05200 [Candidatus Eisenbacteria bacterium]|nr:hypothetical protein [Candidatus Eisenbacteria bacterium]
MKNRTLLEGLDIELAILKDLVSRIESRPVADRLKTRRYDETMMDLEYRLRKLRRKNYFL